MQNTNLPAERRHPIAAVAARYKRRVNTIRQWSLDPATGFPAPVVIRRRLYFLESDLQKWEKLMPDLLSTREISQATE
jgi:hypothetical protein